MNVDQYCAALLDCHIVDLEPVQELFRVFRAGSRVDGVVPLRTNGMAGELNGLELGVADTLTGLVSLLKVRRRHLQPRVQHLAMAARFQNTLGALPRSQLQCQAKSSYGGLPW